MSLDKSGRAGGRDNPISLLLDNDDDTTEASDGGRDNPIVLDHDEDKDDSFDLPSQEVRNILDNIGEKVASDKSLLAEVKSRGYRITEFMTDDEVAKEATDRGIRLLIDARPTRLIHELHRQHMDLSLDAYYNRGWGDVPAGCDLLIPASGASKMPVEQKRFATVRHFAPRGVYDFDVDMTDNLDRTDDTDDDLVGLGIDLSSNAKEDEVSFFTDIH